MARVREDSCNLVMARVREDSCNLFMARVREDSCNLFMARVLHVRVIVFLQATCSCGYFFNAWHVHVIMIFLLMARVRDDSFSVHEMCM